MNVSTLLRRCDRIDAAVETPQTKPRPQFHIWVCGDELPHGTPEEQEKYFLHPHISSDGKPLDPNRDIVVHWPKEEYREC